MRVNLWRRWLRQLNFAFSRKFGIVRRGRRRRSQALRPSSARVLERQAGGVFAPTFERLEDRLLLSGTVELGSTAAFDYDGLPQDATISGMSDDGNFVLFQTTAANVIAGQVDTNNAMDVFLLDRSTGEIKLVSHTGTGLSTGNGSSQNAQISADGSTIVFESQATNLMTAAGVTDANGTRDVLAYDVATGTLALVSHTGTGLSTGNSYSQNARISDDGSTIVFESAATNLISGVTDTNGNRDVFAYDVETGTLTLVSHTGTGLSTGIQWSANARISGDGSTIVFESVAWNLMTAAGVTDANGSLVDVFVYDVETGTLALVSHTGTGLSTGNNHSYNAQISADGSTIVFQSYATNLDENVFVPAGKLQVYVSDNQEIALASERLGPPSVTANGSSRTTEDSVSDDGRYVVFQSTATNLVAGQVDTNSTTDVFLLDRLTGEIKLVSHTGTGLSTGNNWSDNAQISGDGSTIVFESYASNLMTAAGVTDANGYWDVFAYDVATGTLALVSHTGTGLSTGNNWSESARISADGSTIVFESAASNLMTAAGVTDANGTVDVFAYNVATGTLALVSHTGTGLSTGNNHSYNAQISGDGSTIVFESDATNLVDEDYNNTWDLFLYLLNDDPTAADDEFTTNENTPATGDLLADNGNGADSDPNTGDTLTLTEINGTAITDGEEIALTYGTLTIHTDGTFSYVFDKATHNLSVGDDDLEETFTYTVDDGNGGSDTATVTITITPTNDTPVPADDDFTAVEVLEDSGATAVGNVLANDTDPDNGETATLAVEAVTDAAGSAGGLFTITDAGVVTFDPNGAFNDLAAGETATASYTYTLIDAQGAEATATVTVQVTGQNDDPTAGDDTLTTDEQSAGVGDLLANDSDPDTSDTLTVSAVNGEAADVDTEITLSSGALLTVHADGTYTYDPNGAFNGLADGATATDSFEYTIDDGNGGSNTATVTITITGLNDGPTAQGDSATTDELSTTTGNLLTNDSDPNGDPLTVTHVNGQAVTNGQTVTLASGARLTIQTNGSYTYDSNGAFNHLSESQTAADTFTYTISDGLGGTATATATMTVTGLDTRGNVTINPKAIAAGKSNVKLNFTGGEPVDLQIVFTDAGVQLIGQNGTTINGLAMLTLDGADSLRGKFGDGNDKITVVGDATKARIDLGGGNNTVVFDDFTSSKQTSVSSKGGSLDFSAIDSTFGKLLVTGGNLDDTLTFLNVRVDNTTTLRLLDGMDNITIHDSTFGGNFSVSSSGNEAAFNVETGTANGAMTQFLGKFRYATGANPAILLGPDADDDGVTFGKQAGFSAKQPGGTLTAGNHTSFARGPNLRNISTL